MFSDVLLAEAAALLDALRADGLKLATAESCTGGLVAGLVTEIPGSSDVLERGFVAYSNEAKIQLLGVPAELIASHGAISREVALAMARGVLAHSPAQVAVSVTGIAGPGGGTPGKPVGLVHLAAMRAGKAPLHEECRFGAIGRTAVRMQAVEVALGLIRRASGAGVRPA